jgi:hypothetical protein
MNTAISTQSDAALFEGIESFLHLVEQARRDLPPNAPFARLKASMTAALQDATATKPGMTAVWAAVAARSYEGRVERESDKPMRRVFNTLARALWSVHDDFTGVNKWYSIPGPTRKETLRLAQRLELRLQSMRELRDTLETTVTQYLMQIAKNTEGPRPSAPPPGPTAPPTQPSPATAS